MKKFKKLCISVLVVLVLSVLAPNTPNVSSLSELPSYHGSSYITINENIPSFEEDELTMESFEYYSELDYLGRCGVAYACIGQDIMPTEER